MSDDGRGVQFNDLVTTEVPMRSVSKRPDKQNLWSPHRSFLLPVVRPGAPSSVLLFLVVSCRAPILAGHAGNGLAAQ